MSSSTAHLAVFIPRLSGGGAERSMLKLAAAFERRGHRVDLVVCRALGELRDAVPQGVQRVELGSTRTLAALPRLRRYLQRARPTAMLSALNHANVVALWARKGLRAPTRLVISERNTVSEAARRGGWKERAIIAFMRQCYGWADGIVANSQGVAEDLCVRARLAKQRVRVIYNPVVTPEMAAQMRAPARHAWFHDGGPPVVLGAGRLVPQKNFAALVRAFARVRQRQALRLMILGEGEERSRLQSLCERLRVAADVALPGFELNPYPAMAHAAVVVVSSFWEGFPNTLAEALACGTTVVSTDCRSGPSEILQGGTYGILVPIDDDDALAGGIVAALQHPFDAALLRRRAADFALDGITDQYLQALLGPT